MENVHYNPIVLKVHNGTPRSDVNLCKTCRYSHAIQTVTGQELIRCTADRVMVMKEAVVRCNRYYDRTAPALHEMQEIAWTLMTDKGGRKLGFSPPDRERNSGSPIGF